MIRKLFLALPLLLPLAGLAEGPMPGLPQKYEDSVIAVVGSEVLTTLDVTMEAWRMERLILNDPSMEKEEKQARVLEMRRKIADSLVQRELMYLEFKARGFQVPPELVVERTAQWIEREAGGRQQEFYQKLKAMNMTAQDFKEMTIKDIAIEMIMAERIYRMVDVSSREVEAYYQKHKAEFAIPAKVKLQALAISPANRTPGELQELLDKVQAGLDAKTPFEELVSKYSDDKNSASKGGDLGWLEEPAMRKEFADAIKGLKNGECTAPFTMNSLKIVLKVNARQEAQSGFTTEVRQRVQKALREEKIEEQTQVFVAELLRRHYVKTYYGDALGAKPKNDTPGT